MISYITIFQIVKKEYSHIPHSSKFVIQELIIQKKRNRQSLQTGQTRKLKSLTLKNILRTFPYITTNTNYSKKKKRRIKEEFSKLVAKNTQKFHTTKS